MCAPYQEKINKKMQISVCFAKKSKMASAAALKIPFFFGHISFFNIFLEMKTCSLCKRCPGIYFENFMKF